MTLEKGQKVLSALETKIYFEEFGRHPENSTDHALMDKILAHKPDYKWQHDSSCGIPIHPVLGEFKGLNSSTSKPDYRWLTNP
jgi:hypothetical protein